MRKPNAEFQSLPLFGASPKFFEGGLVLGGGREVGPLVGVVLHVVELFRAVFVADIAPLVCSDREVSGVEHGDELSLCFRSWVFKKRDEGLAVEFRRRLDTAEIGESGVEIDQADGAVAG